MNQSLANLSLLAFYACFLRRAYEFNVLKVDFVKLSETANPANKIFNPTPKDDPPDIPRNMLYAVESPAGSRYHVTLEVNDQPTSMRSKLMHAVYNGDTKLTTGEEFFPASGPVNIIFNHPAPGVFVTDFEIRVGYDLNGNRSLDNDEIIYPLNVKDTAGLVIGPPMVRGASVGRYAVARAIIFGGTYYRRLPHTAYLLDVFRNPAVATAPSVYRPTKSGYVSFNCFSGPFSEWLTHNAGASFPASGGTSILKYEWDASTSFAMNLVGTSFEMTNALLTFYSNVVLSTATSYFSTSSESTATFPLSGALYDIPHGGNFSPMTILFDDPALNNLTRDDPAAAIARARLNQHMASYSLERKPLPGGDFSIHIVQIHHFGEIEDLYDFNYEAAMPAPLAAIVQIGFGNGGYGRTQG